MGTFSDLWTHPGKSILINLSKSKQNKGKASIEVPPTMYLIGWSKYLFCVMHQVTHWYKRLQRYRNALYLLLSLFASSFKMISAGDSDTRVSMVVTIHKDLLTQRRQSTKLQKGFPVS